MASKHQLRGALLEEVILVLLRSSGYIPVTEKGSDPTLEEGGAGLLVKGRGTNHQIDAIADFTIPQPFTNPQRLLVEAKAYDGATRVDLGVVRNTVGVLKDVTEYWRVEDRSARAKQRYHYQAAIFSSTGFSRPAQEYAYAQDIYLLPLSRSTYFTPILDATNQVSADLAEDPSPAKIRELRRHFRAAMRGELMHPELLLLPLIDASRGISSALLAMIAKQFPVFLVPQTPQILDDLRDTEQVRIYYDERGWYLGREGRQYLFSFDLPYQLFEMYAEDGRLSASAAADMKAEYLRVLSAFHIRDGRPRVITFTLDRQWLDTIRRRIHTAREREERHRHWESENHG